MTRLDQLKDHYTDRKIWSIQVLKTDSENFIETKILASKTPIHRITSEGLLEAAGRPIPLTFKICEHDMCNGKNPI